MLDEIINYVQSLQQQVEVRCRHQYSYLFVPQNQSLQFSLNSNTIAVLLFQFLSMKLSTVNPELDFSTLSTLLHKDVSLNHLVSRSLGSMERSAS